MRGKRERWVGELYDAEGRRWRLRAAPWFVRSRVLVRVDDDWNVVEGPAAEKAREALGLCLGGAVFLAFVIAFDRGKFSPELWIGIVVIPLGIWAFSATYRGIRRFAVAAERFSSGQCPSCGYQLVQPSAPAQRTVRCPECGHLWAWPAKSIESPVF
ncbi:MAG: transposase [Phycisphaerales bacterium]|nr:transposase [Phycisphaerales bacterium]